MKKTPQRFLALLATISAVSFSLAGTALAQTASQTTPIPAAVTTSIPVTKTLKAQDVIPSNVDMFVEFNNAEKNPFGMMLKDALKKADLSPSITTNGKIHSLVEKILDKNTVSMGIKVNPMSKSADMDMSMYLIIPVGQKDFEQILTVDRKAKFTPLASGKHTIYAPAESAEIYFTKLENLLIVSNEKKNLVELLKTYDTRSTNVLKNNALFQKTMASKLPKSFFDFYMDPKFAFEVQEKMQTMRTGMDEDSPMMFENPFIFMMKPGSFYDKIAKAITAESFSVAQGDNAFLFKGMVMGDKAKLKEIEMPFDKYNFTPELYKKISGKDLLFYSEGVNLKDQFTSLVKMFTDSPESVIAFTDWKKEFKTNTTVDFDQDIMAMLGGKHLLSIHKSEDLYPAVTLVFDVKDSSQKAAATLEKLLAYLEEEIKPATSENTQGTFESKKVTINGANFTEWNIDDSSAKNTSLDPSTQGLSKFTVHFGITTDGLLVISNHSNLAGLLSDSQGMAGNEKFKKNLAPLDETVASIMFLDMDSVRTYAHAFSQKMGASRSLSERDLETSKNNINTYLAPWHDLSVKSYATEDTSWFNGKLNIDEMALAKMGESLKALFPEDTKESNFCDVKNGDWFSDDVSTLSKRGVVKGYYDGCFRPHQPVNRAEFIHMLGTELDNMSYEPKFATRNNQRFNDVSEDDWFFSDVDWSSQYKLVNGYGDGNFKPENNLTRAEAAQILANVITASESTGNDTIYSMDFDDIQKNAWYTNALAKITAKKIMNGTSENTFEPNRNLTRAEAAKIINNFTKYYSGSHQ